jgi:hypothetical protein
MDENPYQAPQEKPIDRGSELWRWRAIDWGFTALFVVVAWASIRGGFFETHRNAVIGLLIVSIAAGAYAHWRVRQAKQRAKRNG